MNESRKTILCVFAHPDDESMGPGGTLARYAAEGHRVAFVLATDGGAGRLFKERPDRNDELRRLRRTETVRAAEILGIEFLGFMGWQDGHLANERILDIEHAIARLIRKEKPDVLVTFHASGISFHPDHRVIAMALASAFRGAAHAGWYAESDVEALPPHRTAKLYEYTVIRTEFERIAWPRVVYGSDDEEISTIIDTKAWADVRWRAIQAHETQQNGPPFADLYEAGVFEREVFVRVFPSWRLGDAIENDLLAGLD